MRHLFHAIPRFAARGAAILVCGANAVSAAQTPPVAAQAVTGPAADRAALAIPTSDRAPSVAGATPAWPALSDDQLRLDTGQGIVLSNQSLNSTLVGNTIGGSYTAGSVNFNAQALSNFAGVGNITVNTGAQAALQSAVNISINLTN